MKKLLIVIAAAFLVSPLIALAVQITVPSAPSGGYALVSTSTGAYIATTTDPFHVGSLYGTSTATSTFNGGIKAPCFSTDGTNCIVSSIASSTNPLMATYFVATSTTVASQFPLASTTAITTSNLCLGGVCYSSISASASSTLLTDNNTFSGNNLFSASTTFSTLINIRNASSTLDTFGTVWIPSLTSGVLETDAAGKVFREATTSTSVAGALVARDSNQNAFANNFISKGTNVSGSGGTTLLTSASTRYQFLSSAGQTFQLPDATTLSIGSQYVFNNNSSGRLPVTDNGGTSQISILPGGLGYLFLTSNVTSNGAWDAHPGLASNDVAGTNGFGIGTTTPFFQLTVASSTGPQLALVDTNPANFAWTLRSISNSFYISTSTHTSTSTTAAFSIGPNGTTTIQNGVNILAGCFSIAGTCLSTGGSSLTGTTGQVAYFSGTNTAVGTSTITISTASNVGIATTSPYGILSVSSSPLTTSVASSSVWSVNGTYTYTTPAGTAFLVVQAWGAGGAGGIAGNSDGGGGAGAFVGTTTINSPASSYTLKVGQGGQNSTGGTGFQSGGNGQGGNGGGGGGSTGFGSTIIACGGGGGSDATGSTNAGGGAGASGTSGGAGGTAPSGSGGGGGGCNTAGTSASSNSGGAGGTGGTSTSGTNGSGGSGATSNANGGGGGSSAGVSGNGNTGTSATGGGGGAGASGSGGAAQGVAGTGADSGGGGRGASNFSTAPTAGGNPGAGGGGCATGVGACTTSANGADGKIIVYAYSYTLASPVLIVGASSTVPFLAVANTGNGGGAVSIGTTTVKAAFTVVASPGDIAQSIWGTISGVFYLFQQIDALGHLWTGGPNPTCGTGCASVTGDDRTMEVVTGSSVSSITVNFANTYTKSPVCIPTEENAGVIAIGASTTPTSVTVTTASALTTKTLGIICQISNNFTF